MIRTQKLTETELNAMKIVIESGIVRMNVGGINVFPIAESTALRLIEQALGNIQAEPRVAPRDVNWGYMPSYGDMNWDPLLEAVAQARYGDRTIPLDDIEKTSNIGHQMVGTMNFNSLNRIVSAYVRAALGKVLKENRDG